MNIHNQVRRVPIQEGGLMPHFSLPARPREIESLGNEIWSRLSGDVEWARAALTKFNEYSQYGKIENAFQLLDVIMQEVKAIHHECDCVADHIIEQRRWDR